VSKNQLTSTIPSTIWQLTMLTELYVDRIADPTTLANDLAQGRE
jgi:hypothetical protein